MKPGSSDASAAELPDREPDPTYQRLWDAVFEIAKRRITLAAPRLSGGIVIHTARAVTNEVLNLPAYRPERIARAAENYVRCARDPVLSPFIRKNGLDGKSPWAELCDAVDTPPISTVDGTES